MTKGAKIAVILFSLAGVALLVASVLLIVESSSIDSDAPPRVDIDLEKVATIFVNSVKTRDDLTTFEAELNTQFTELVTNEELYVKPGAAPAPGEAGAATPPAPPAAPPASTNGAAAATPKVDGPVEVVQLADGSILGGVDKNDDGHLTLFTAEGGQPLRVSITQPQAFVDPAYRRLTAAKDKDDLPPLDEEVLFFLRVTKAQGEGAQLIASDRYHNAFRAELNREFQAQPIYGETVEHQRAYYGGHWRPPLFFFWYSPGYYNTWSSSRARSVGSRWGSGGVGGGK